MPQKFGRTFVMKDPIIAQEIDNLYRLLQQRDLDVDPEFAKRIAGVIPDGSLRTLTNFLTGRQLGRAVVINQTLDDTYALYVNKQAIPGAAWVSLFVGMNDADLNAAIMEQVGLGRVLKLVGGHGTNELLHLEVDAAGTGLNLITNSLNTARLTRAGIWADACSSALKVLESYIEPKNVMKKLKRLRIFRWISRVCPTEVHMSPTAEEFKRLLEVGDGESLAPMDVASLAVLGVQYLAAKVEELEKRVKQLEKGVSHAV